jgi:hypothetical protein
MQRRWMWLSAMLLLAGTGPVWAAHGGGHGGHASAGHVGGSATSGTSGAGTAGAASGAAAGVAAGDPGGKGTQNAKGVVATQAPSVMNKGGSLQPGAGFADTQIPYGSTDSYVQGGPGMGGMGGSSMQVSDYGKKSWPCYPAGQWAGSPDFKPPAGCPK